MKVEERIKKTEGITLVALIITIIVLVILATVTIYVIVENNFIDITQKAGETYSIKQIQEELEVEIANLITQKANNLQRIKREDLLELRNIGAIIETTDVPTIIQYKGCGFEIDENYKVKVKVIENTNPGEIMPELSDKPILEVKDLTTKGFILNVKNKYKDEDVTFSYYINGKLVAENINETHYKVNNLRDTTNAYVVANIKENKISSDKIYIDAINELPRLTENTGNIIVDGFVNNYNYNYYHAFDRNDSSYTYTIYANTIGGYIGYDFEKPVRVTTVTGKIRMLSYKIQYADNLEEWKDAITASLPGSENGDNFSNEIDENIGAHRYWRLYVNGGQKKSGWSALVYSLQFYVVNEYANVYSIEEKILPLTENTVNIIANGFLDNYKSSQWGERNYYYAFDGDDTTIAGTAGNGSVAIGSYIGYDFEKPVNVSSVTGKIRMLSYKIQYADNLGEWKDAITASSPGSDHGDNFSNEIDENIGAHRYWRLYVNGGQKKSDWGAMVYSLQFYEIKDRQSIKVNI